MAFTGIPMCVGTSAGRRVRTALVNLDHVAAVLPTDNPDEHEVVLSTGDRFITPLTNQAIMNHFDDAYTPGEQS